MKKPLFWGLILLFLLVGINRSAEPEIRSEVAQGGDNLCCQQQASTIEPAQDKGLLELNQPVADLKANSSDKPIMVLPQDKVSISLSLDPGSYTDQKADWWIAAETPFGLFSYVHPNWQKGLHYCLQAPLDGFSTFPILESPLPQGNYTFYFAVDNNADGIADATWWDLIDVQVVSPLEAADNSSVTNRTPLILVHGNNSESEPDYRWADYLEKSKQDSDFSTSFKVYLFQWDSDKSNKFNANALGTAIDGQAGLKDRKLIIMAHSRGGLVSRYYLNDYITKTGSYSGQPAGQRVEHLITLGTPNRGSPLADPYWSIFSFDYNFQSFLAEPLSSFYLNYIYDPSYNNLLWDDSENELTKGQVCWHPAILEDQTEFCSVLPSTQTELSELNKRDSYLDRIIAFGGNEFDGQTFQWSLEWGEHRALSAFSTLLADVPIIPPSYPETSIDDQYRPFQANDGMVPLTSALNLKSGSEKIFTVDDGQLNYDPQEVESLCRFKECIVIEDRQTDHLDLLDDEDIIDLVLRKIKKLR